MDRVREFGMDEWQWQNFIQFFPYGSDDVDKVRQFQTPAPHLSRYDGDHDENEGQANDVSVSSAPSSQHGTKQPRSTGSEENSDSAPHVSGRLPGGADPQGTSTATGSQHPLLEDPTRSRAAP